MEQKYRILVSAILNFQILYIQFIQNKATKKVVRFPLVILICKTISARCFRPPLVLLLEELKENLYKAMLKRYFFK
jgi:hypothetical protein